MIKHILSDFSRVLVFPREQHYEELLNRLYEVKVKKESKLFGEVFVVNVELLAFFDSLTSVDLSIFTSDRFQNDPEILPRLNKTFSHIFSALDPEFKKGDGGKYSKSDLDGHAYVIVANQLQAKPHEILFIDDTVENVNAAQKAGLITVRYSAPDRNRPWNDDVMREVREKLAQD